MSDWLDHRQGILDTVCQFAKQQFLLLIPGLAFCDIAGALERQLPAPMVSRMMRLSTANSRPSLVVCFNSPFQFPSSSNLNPQLGE